MEEEARVILSEKVAFDAEEWIERARLLRARIGGEWDSVRMIEEARAELDAKFDRSRGLPEDTDT